MNNSKRNSWLPGYLALGLTWGSSFLLIKWTLDGLTPLGVAFSRGFIGGVTLLAYCLIKGNPLPNKLSEWGHLAVVALLLNAIPGFLFAYGETHVSSVMAGLLNATTPLMTVLVISFGFREQKVNRNQIVGVVIGFVGIILVTGALGKGEKNDSIGVLALLLATFCYGIAFPYSKKYVGSMKYSSGSLAATQVSCSALMLLPFVLFSNPIKSEINIKTLVAMILLGSFGTGFAYIWNFRNVRLAGSTMASTVTYLTPIVASILGIAILGEPASMIQLFGGLLVLVSAALVQQRFKIFSDRKVDANEDFSI